MKDKILKQGIFNVKWKGLNYILVSYGDGNYYINTTPTNPKSIKVSRSEFTVNREL